MIYKKTGDNRVEKGAREKRKGYCMDGKVNEERRDGRGKQG